MITFVFDTNIFISAFEFDIRTSKPLLDELSRVLRDRFEYSGEKVTEIRKRLETFKASVPLLNPRGCGPGPSRAKRLAAHLVVNPL